MHDSFAVHMLQCPCYLVNISPDLFFREADFILACTLHDHLEVAFLSPLDCNEQLVQLVVDEPAQVLHDVRVI